ncbi:hypothetical protein COHA_000116 [Chlorella ohadii]|uniref:Uncharacterized protein n=1 Tax=Chlorella ohadii TaxID=2649997 RepID=A0AAD5E134_9CHLO|nr:hypothetical protein COHA_000116 [Chlorella ohadii]
MSQAQPGFLRRALPAASPEQGESATAVLRDIKALVLPGLTHWQHPRFFAYFPCCASVPSILGGMLAAAVNVLGFQWAASPACTELEQISLDWLAALLNLPPNLCPAASPAAGAVLYGTASEALLAALLAAKARTLAGRQPEDALKLVVYATDQTHSCCRKACMVAGILHMRQLRTCSEQGFAMQPQALEAAVQADLAAGLLPCFVCATIGTTGCCAVDPVGELAPVARSHGMWLHVDAAWAGAFAILPAQREAHFRGLEGADSYDVNPHKALLCGWECSAAYFRDIQWVRRALTVPAADSPYLQNDRCGSGRFSLRLFEGPLGQAGDEADAGMPTAAGMGTTAALPSRSGLTSTSSTAETKAAIATISGCGSSSGSGGGEPAGRQAPASLEPPLERSDLDIVFGHGGFRGLRLWMVLRMYGANGLRHLMQHRLRMQSFLADLVAADERFELVVPPRFGLVCFRLRGCTNQANAELLEAVNRSGTAFLSHTMLSGRYVIRCALGGTLTQGCHVETAWRTVQRCAGAVLVA